MASRLPTRLDVDSNGALKVRVLVQIDCTPVGGIMFFPFDTALYHIKNGTVVWATDEKEKE